MQTETIDVQVLGTHFNVDAYPDNPDVKTTLLTGSVAVSNKNNSVRMVLKPNEVAIYNKVEQKLTRKVLENAGDEISWRHGEFIFDDLPLQEIARELSNSFGTTIHIADSTLRNYRITARFRNGEDLDAILSVLHMPVISTIHETLNRLLLLKTRLNENYSPRTPTCQNARSDRYGDPYHRTGIRTECKCPTHNHIAKCYIEGVRQVNRNSTGYSFIYSEEISISHKINLKVKDMPLHEILDLVFKDEPISYKFSERYILLQKKRVQKPVSRKFTISGYVTTGRRPRR